MLTDEDLARIVALVKLEIKDEFLPLLAASDTRTQSAVTESSDRLLSLFESRLGAFEARLRAFIEQTADSTVARIVAEFRKCTSSESEEPRVRVTRPDRIQ